MARAPRLSLPAVLHALSDPVRLQIVRQLADEGETACGTFDIPLAKSSLSHHFKVLREAGVVATRREGVRSLNVLRLEELEREFPGVVRSILVASSKHQ